MYRRVALVPIYIGMLLWVCGCHEETVTEEPSRTAPGPGPAPTTRPARRAPSGVSSADRMFVRDAAGDGLKEVRLGEVAVRKSSNPDVKALGQKLIDDHTAANQELARLAERKGITVPSAIRDKDLRDVDQLAAAHAGADFDRAWARAVVEDHREDIKKFREEARTADDPDVRAWARKMIPALEDHLKRAQDVSREVGAPPVRGAPGERRERPAREKESE